jgi:hypothetical protein
MFKVFIGADPRQTVSLTTLMHSIVKHSKSPVSLTPLVIQTLPMKREGLTPFTWSRFLVPYLCNYQGFALFLDADMLVRGDITELFAHADGEKAVQVMKDQPRFEWASAILYNCAHPANRVLSPEYVDDPSTKDLHSIKWVKDELVGEFPREWNVCIPYTQNPPENPKLVHFTQGVPHWWETLNQPYADEWIQTAKESIGSTVSWFELMGRSVHRDPVIRRLIDTKEIASVDEYIERVGLVLRAAQ